MPSKRHSFSALLFVGTLVAARSAAAQYDAPANYYNAVESLPDANKPKGTALRTAIRSLNPAVTKQNYGDARYSPAYTDADPNAAGRILSVYSRTSMPAAWDFGQTWNREHLWPQSRLGATASNSTTNIASDQFELRPAASSENSVRGNNSYGGVFGSGSPRNIGSFFYPGDIEAGDVARAAFYMATMYTQLNLVNGTGNPDNNEMGDLAALLRYHYRDRPDTFEQRRNHAIYGKAGATGPALTNPYAQGNRNPFVDHPEYVWSAFVDQANDSRLRFGTASATGASATTVDLGRVLRNATVPAAKSVTLTKDGVDGTYYSVTAAGGATSSLAGRNNAFAMDAVGSQTITVGLATSTATAGLKTGTVTIDNLDITTAGAAGQGGNDANDVATVQLKVLDGSNPSFGASGVSGDLNELTLNFGSLYLGTPARSTSFSLSNLPSALGADLTAGLDLDSFSIALVSGASNPFTTNLATFTNLLAGGQFAYSALFTPGALGTYRADHTLALSDENLPGTGSTSTLRLTLLGIVAIPGDYNGDGYVDAADYTVWADGFGQTGATAPADGNGDNRVDAADYTIWADHFGQGTAPGAGGAAIPEPATLGLFALLIPLHLRRR